MPPVFEQKNSDIAMAKVNNKYDLPMVRVNSKYDLPMVKPVVLSGVTHCSLDYQRVSKSVAIQRLNV